MNTIQSNSKEQERRKSGQHASRFVGLADAIRVADQQPVDGTQIAYIDDFAVGYYVVILPTGRFYSEMGNTDVSRHEAIRHSIKRQSWSDGIWYCARYHHKVNFTATFRSWQNANGWALEQQAAASAAPAKQYKINDVDADWYNSRETDEVVAVAIHAIADETRTPEQIWSDPTNTEYDHVLTAIENLVTSGRFDEQDSYQWGEEAISIGGRISPNSLIAETRQAAKQGDAEAQCNLGVMYLMGDGVDKDPAEAVRWFRAAAEQGHAKGQLYLGVRLARGEGVDKDLVEAANWFRKAAEQGEIGAQFNLGLACANGDGVDTDRVQAYAWLSLADVSGFHSSIVALVRKKELAKCMNPAQMEEALVLEREYRDAYGPGQKAHPVSDELSQNQHQPAPGF